jgi:hypothetical protein
VQPTDLGLVGFRASEEKHEDREEDERGTGKLPEGLLTDEGTVYAAVHHADGDRRYRSRRRRVSQGLLVRIAHRAPRTLGRKVAQSRFRVRKRLD